MAGQDFLFGVTRPDSQFLMVSMLTPSFVPMALRESLACKRLSNSNLRSGWPSISKGGESTLVARNTRWQNGRINTPFRHCPNGTRLVNAARGGTLQP
jgi:hypothetical protein